MSHSPNRSSGVLVLVVGPSGAGKDALTTAARHALGDDPDVVFARRVITRPPLPAAEDHDTMDEAGFAAAEAAGDFALTWRAHGLAYGVPATIRDALATGRMVVVNASRRVVGTAEAEGVPVAVVHVTAAPAVLAERIARRGREEAAAIAARLRREAPIAATTARVIEVRNDDTLAAGAARFLAALAEARRLSR